jgi:AbrB family looped-hinge helix DNA binding protein
MNFFPKPKVLAVAQLNDKGQLVIPKEAREAIGIGPGDRLIVALAPFGQALVLARPESIEEHLNSIIESSETSKQELMQEISTISQQP